MCRNDAHTYNTWHGIHSSVFQKEIKFDTRKADRQYCSFAHNIVYTAYKLHSYRFLHTGYTWYTKFVGEFVLLHIDVNTSIWIHMEWTNLFDRWTSSTGNFNRAFNFACSARRLTTMQRRAPKHPRSTHVPLNIPWMQLRLTHCKGPRQWKLILARLLCPDSIVARF